MQRKRRLLISLLTASYVILCGIKAKAQPVVNISRQYYSVSGSTVEQIAQSLYQNTPVIYQGKKFHAYTSWNIQWRFRWQQSNNSCSLNRNTITVDIQYTLPRLANENRLPQSVQSRWQHYYTALVRHEDGHRDFGLKAAQEIDQLLSRMGSRRSCQQLEQDANQLANGVIAKYVVQEREYDRQTNHGVRQGAIWP